VLHKIFRKEAQPETNTTKPIYPTTPAAISEKLLPLGSRKKSLGVKREFELT
jgi:hypothetical protein